MTKADKEGQRKTPILRFKGFTDDWEQRKLSELTQQVKRTRDSENPILTISAKNGWMDQKDRFNRVIAGKELKNYIELYENELSYNHGNSKYAKFGIIYVQRKYKKALVPKVYHSFSMTNGDPRFIENLSLGHKLDKELSKLITSGARQDGLLNINKNSFYSIKLFIPSEQEQIKISNIMDILNHIITLYDRKLKLLSQVKKYFLNNLFAKKEYPNLRFKYFKKDNWEKVSLNSIVTYRNGKAHEKEINNKGNLNLVMMNSITTEGNLITKKKIFSPQDTLSKNDIVIVLSDIAKGELIGKSSIIPCDDQYVLNQRIGCLQPTLNIDSFFVSKCINQKSHYFKSHAAGTSQINLSKSDVLNCTMYIPDVDEQHYISNFIINVEKIINFYKNKKRYLTEIKRKLLNTMFI